MGRASEDQHAINAGELSSLLLGRQDLAKYASGLYVCNNGIPLTQGAWTRRPGTAFLHQTKYNTKESRVIPFQYSVTQTYVLEFGEGYIRFYTDHGILVSVTQNITALSQAEPVVLTYSGADNFVNGDRVHIADVGGMVQVNDREFEVRNVATGSNEFELMDSEGVVINGAGYSAYTSGGTVSKIYEVTTAFVEADLAQIRVVQSADTLYILHPDFPPQKLVRNSAVSWTLSDLVFVDGPYDAVNTTATTLTPSAFAPGAGVTLTASAITGINNDTGFQTTDVGRLIRMLQGSTWGYVIVTGWTSTTVVTVTVVTTLTSTAAKSSWRLGVWSDTTGFPSCGTFHEDRLWLAGAALFPQRIDGSKSSVYTDFSPSNAAGTVANDNAISETLNSSDVNSIKWLASNDRALLVGTTRGEWVVRASTATAALTPTDKSAKPSTHYGSADMAPAQAGRSILFTQRAGRKVRELAYVYELDGFRAPDLSLLSEHITRPSITEIAFQEQPQAILWCVRSDGVLLGMTYERDQDVVAWHRHELGGVSDEAGLEIPVVESIAVVPSPDTTRDELYMVVQRFINAVPKRYVEYMTKMWEQDDEQEDAFHLDCGWTIVNSSPSATFDPPQHLLLQSVAVYVDGMRHPDLLMSDGPAELNFPGTIITVGYAYNSDGQTLPLEGGSADGSAQGKIKKINRLGLWLLDTLGLQIGPDADNLTELIVRRHGDEFGAATELFTGVVRERFEGDYDRLGQVYWRAGSPFPATVLSVMPQFDVADDS